MKPVIVRDDDVSAFTEPDLLQRVYGDFLDMGGKLSFSVIPEVDSSLALRGKNPFQSRYKYEPFVPPEKINTGRHNVSENKKIVKWLNREGVEICMHGFSHDLEEYSSSDYGYVDKITKRGIKTLRGSFGRKPKIFVPPHERLSKTAWRTVVDSGFHIFRNVTRPAKDLLHAMPLREITSDVLGLKFFTGVNGLVKLRNSWLIGTMDPYMFSAFWNPEQSYERACRNFDRSDIFIIANHHWEFDINPDMTEYWNRFADYMKENEAGFMTASEAIRRVGGNR